jgi:hypothetical protein
LGLLQINGTTNISQPVEVETSLNSASDSVKIEDNLTGVDVGTDSSFVFANSDAVNTTKLIDIPIATNLTKQFEVIVKNPSDVSDLTVTLFDKCLTLPTYTEYVRKTTLSIPKAVLGAINTCKVYDAGGASFATETTDINSAGANDVPAVPIGTVEDAIYFGDDIKFNGLRINTGTAGDYVATVVWEYYNGSTWTTLTTTDGTTAFKTAGKKDVTFNIPANWATVAVDSATKYWIRARVSAFTSVTTAPLLTQAWTLGVRGYVAHSNIVQGLFNGTDIALAISNDTVLGATDGFTGHVRIKEL